MHYIASIILAESGDSLSLETDSFENHSSRLSSFIRYTFFSWWTVCRLKNKLQNSCNVQKQLFTAEVSFFSCNSCEHYIKQILVYANLFHKFKEANQNMSINFSNGSNWNQLTWPKICLGKRVRGVVGDFNIIF